MTASGTLFIVSAPSGAGKTSLVQALVSSMDDISVSVSHTTRAGRLGERDGLDYYFVDEGRFEAMVAQGDFLEHARVFGNLYGTARETVAKHLAQGRDIILEIDWQGADQVRSVMPAAVSIFILPPSHEELERRLRARNSDDPDAVRRRLGEAAAELSHYAEFEYLVVNDAFERALADLQAIVRACRLRLPVQQSHLAAELAALMAQKTLV